MGYTFLKIPHQGQCNGDLCIICFGLVWRSHKSAAEVTIALSLVWDFQKGISCRGKYVLFGLVWWSPKSAAKVTIAMYLVWSFQKGLSSENGQRLEFWEL